MESIKVTPETLRSKADEIIDKAGQYYTTYGELLEEARALTTDGWKGDDATKFYDQIDGFRDDFKKMKELMDEYAEFLKEAASSYEANQQNIIDTISSLQN